jgi:methyl-accepting chemotaxis protein
MQSRHWKIILAGRFDDQFEQSARKIGLTHYRLGLEPQLYLGGYNFLMAEICEGVGLRLPSGWNERNGREKRGKLQAAFIRAAMLDIEISQSIYLEALREARNADLKKVADELDRSIAATVASVTATAGNLQNSSNAMNHSALATVAQAQAVEAAATLTSSNVNAVSAATTQMSHSIAEITQQTRRSHQIAESSSEAARKSEQWIGQLSDAANQIGGIVGLIQAIAGKTNMLALNATIEAARAGEAGRGFAVVASEVKALAEQTARATDEIGDKIAAIQTGARRVAENIDAIALTTGETSMAATGIVTAVEQQGAATEEISRNITEASQSVAEVASSARTVSQAAEASSAISGDVLEASRQLTRQASDLSANMQRFLKSLQAA